MNDFMIAGFLLRTEGPHSDPVAAGLAGFRPFARAADPARTPLATLQTGVALPDWTQGGMAGVEVLHAFDFEDEDTACIFARDAQAWLFAMAPRDGRPVTLLRMPFASACAQSNIGLEGPVSRSLLRFGLWMLACVALAPAGGIPVHTSTIACEGSAVLFLGESGTGKSTHTRLWRQHISGAELLNDDSPILSLREGRVVVSGSPWSGKTPCYRDLTLPVRGIVRLSQAPHNRIRRLESIGALAALLPSCPPSLAYDERLQDAVCATLSQVIASVPVYHLECLPDRAAALLSHSTLFPGR